MRLRKGPPEAVTLVKEGAGPSRLTRFFRNRQEASEFCAQEWARHHSAYGLGRRCIACGEADRDVDVAIRWEARFAQSVGLQWLMLLLGHIGVKIKYESVGFETHHPMCLSCSARARWKRWLANVLNFIALFLILVAGGAAALFWCGVFYFDSRQDKAAMLHGALIASGLLVLGAVCLLALRPLRVPHALRHIGQRPFYYRGARISTAKVDAGTAAP
jgi:hypothetical protein